MKRRTVLRAGIVAATAAIVATVTVQQAEAAPGWQVSVLPLPDGYDSATTGYLGGTDGRGSYAGTLFHDGKYQLILWNHGKPEVQQVPNGFGGADVADENGSGVVVGTLYRPGATGSPFVLDRGGIRTLPLPAGDPVPFYAPIAINDRGDILGSGTYNGSTTRQILWPAHDYAHPIVLPLDRWFAVGLDDDGTVLLDNGSQSALWKDGGLRIFASSQDGKFPVMAGIKAGRIVGVYTDYVTNRSVFWPTPDKALDLPDSSGAFGLNRFGLIVGAGPRPSEVESGPLSAWLGTRPLGALPIPAEYKLGSARKVGDDGTIAGIVTNGDPTYNGGRPAIWRWRL